MASRCRESWRLFRVVEARQREAGQRGYSIDENYRPFFEALETYRKHFTTCPDCRAWVDEMDPTRR